MQILKWLALSVVGAVAIAVWMFMTLPRDAVAQSREQRLHCQMDFALVNNPVAATKELVASWGYDFEVLSGVKFQQAHGYDVYQLMMAASMACRGRTSWNWDQTERNSEAKDTVSGWLNN